MNNSLIYILILFLTLFLFFNTSKLYNQKGGQTTFDPQLQIKICNHIKTNFPEFNLNTKIVFSSNEKITPTEEFLVNIVIHKILHTIYLNVYLILQLN